MVKKIYLLMALFLYGTLICVHAQQYKTQIVKDDCDRWQNFVGSAVISADGKWICWIVEESGKNAIYLQRIGSDEQHVFKNAYDPQFSRDSNWFIYTSDEKSEVFYFHLPTQRKTSTCIEEASFTAFSKNNRNIIIITGGRYNRHKNKEIFIFGLDKERNLKNINNIIEYSVDNLNRTIAYISVEENNKYCIQLLNADNGGVKKNAESIDSVSDLKWENSNSALSYISNGRDPNRENQETLFICRNLSRRPRIDSIVFNNIKGIPDGMQFVNKKLPEYGDKLGLSCDLSSLFFYINLKRVEVNSTKKDTANVWSATASPDIWHWRELEMEDRFRGKQLDRCSNNGYLCAASLDARHFIQLSSPGIGILKISPTEQFVVLKDTRKYRPAFKQEMADLYLVSLKTGQKKLLAEEFVLHSSYFEPFELLFFSPDESRVAYYKNSHWWCYDIVHDKHINLTERVPTRFEDVNDDRSGLQKPPAGCAGWEKSGKEVLLYDEYDIYSVAYDAKAYKKLTSGSNNKIVFRIGDQKQRTIDLTLPVILSARGITTGFTGYYELTSNAMTKLVYENKLVSGFVKSDNSKVYSYIIQTANQSPTLMVASKGAQSSVLIFETNLWQKNCYRSRNELINFKNKKGEQLQGALYYPANYDSTKKYPMVVHLYERLSRNLHYYKISSHSSPQSPYGISFFNNNGYFVFEPDIKYEINDPGISATDCVVSAVEEVLRTRMVDKERIGLMGHSWGGYQTAFIITQTNLFRAAVAGAPLTDMISMSLGMRWGGGSTNRLFEGGQARFAGPYYEHVDAYIRNSPVFQATKINTPLLIAFGDKDEAVDWRQGIEMYNAMRRLQKPCVMLVYKGESHGLNRSRESQADYGSRQMQYFDHYLKGKPAPSWIENDNSQ